jgi:hypothetical protein
MLTKKEKRKLSSGLKLEESWISIIEDKLNNEKEFLNKYQGIFISKLKSIKDILDVMQENNYFKKKLFFSGLNKVTDLSKIEYILITYVTCINLYTKLSYNSNTSWWTNFRLYLL